MCSASTANSQAVLEWMKFFPKQVTENYTSSVTFMKQLTVVAISTITYLKEAFPADSYIRETFTGINLNILKKKCSNDDAQFLSTALIQAFDALEKRYLHQLALCFYEDECKTENLLEYYVFEYTYLGDGVTVNVHSKSRASERPSAKCTFDSVKESTVQLIKACVIMIQSCHTQLPNNYDVSLRLYYNDDTPAEYQAPGYSADGVDGADPLADYQSYTKLGLVETPFHRLCAKSFIRDPVSASHEAIASQNPPVITQAEEGHTKDLSASSAQVTVTVRCACNRRDVSSPAAMLTCLYCGKRQHAVCYGVRRAHAALVSHHCCIACHDAQRTRRVTDTRLATLATDYKREMLCVFRRTLDACEQLSAVGARSLQQRLGLSANNAAKLVSVLHSHQIIQLRDGDDCNKEHKIIKERLKSVTDRFFHNVDEENIVDRLMAESVASQEVHSDPISEILSPLEMVTLQNTSKVCRVVEPADVNKEAVEDATLKQYREAMMSIDTVEEPPANPTGDLGEVAERKSGKRRVDENKEDNRSGLRRAVRSKRARLPAK